MDQKLEDTYCRCPRGGPATWLASSYHQKETTVADNSPMADNQLYDSLLAFVQRGLSNQWPVLDLLAHAGWIRSAPVIGGMHVPRMASLRQKQQIRPKMRRVEFLGLGTEILNRKRALNSPLHPSLPSTTVKKSITSFAFRRVEPE